MRVGLTYDADQAGDPSIREVTLALSNLGHEVIQVGPAPQLVDKLAAGQRFELIFPCAGATNLGDDATITNLMTTYGIAGVFSSAPTLTICNQTHVMKSLLRDRGVPTSDYWLVETLGDIARVDVRFPATIRSTLRCDRAECLPATDASQLSKACCQVMGQYGTPAMIEPQLESPLIEVAMLGSGATAKVLTGKDLSPSLASSIERTAQAAWRIVGGLDAGSMNLQCDSDQQPHVVSIDPIPNLGSKESFMRLAQAAGLSQAEVLRDILESAAQRTQTTASGPRLRSHLNRISSASKTVS